ncbi:transcriptional regulator GlxA family with amidase domain [Arthrobacter sp. UYEF21]
MEHEVEDAQEENLPESVLEALRAADARGAWVMSICSGAFALARAGLLNGRRFGADGRAAPLDGAAS